MMFKQSLVMRIYQMRFQQRYEVMKYNDERILGIDPGSRITGFGIIDIVEGKTKYITSGIINISSSTTATT